ncbi:hypothetical protein JCM10212_005594 [Sporobolomyces blumeae]
MPRPLPFADYPSTAPSSAGPTPPLWGSADAFDPWKIDEEDVDANHPSSTFCPSSPSHSQLSTVHSSPPRRPRRSSSSASSTSRELIDERFLSPRSTLGISIRVKGYTNHLSRFGQKYARDLPVKVGVEANQYRETLANGILKVEAAKANKVLAVINSRLTDDELVEFAQWNETHRQDAPQAADEIDSGIDLQGVEGEWRMDREWMPETEVSGAEEDVDSLGPRDVDESTTAPVPPRSAANAAPSSIPDHPMLSDHPSRDASISASAARPVRMRTRETVGR